MQSERGNRKGSGRGCTGMQVFQPLRQSVGPGGSGSEKKRLEAHDRVMRRGSLPTADGNGCGILAARRGTGRGGQDVAAYRESTRKMKIQERVRVCADRRGNGTCGAWPDKGASVSIKEGLSHGACRCGSRRVWNRSLEREALAEDGGQNSSLSTWAAGGVDARPGPCTLGMQPEHAKSRAIIAPCAVFDKMPSFAGRKGWASRR